MNLEHVIQPGETWEDIAALYGISVEMLLIFNQIRTYDPIYTEVEYGNGRYQTLHIPDPTIEWCIDDTTFTPELVPCDRPDTLEEQMLVAEQAGLLPIEIALGTGVTSTWPEWQTIRQMPIAASIVGYDAAGFYLVQDAQGQTTAYSVWQIQNLGDFDPERLTRDFLYQWLGDDEENADYETLDERAEFWLLQQLAVWIAGLSYFESREIPPSPDTIRGRLEALLGDSYTYEAVVQLALAVIETLQQSPYAQSASIAALDELARQAALYEMAAQLDAVRLALHQWSPQQEQALLSQLDTHLATIPEVVLNVSTVELVGGFKNFHDVMCQRYEMLLNLQYRVLEAEEYFGQLRKQTDANRHPIYIDINTLYALMPMLVETMLSIFIEPIDWILTARDVLGGEVLALVGLLPFIPGSIARLRRLAGSIPEFMREARRIFGGIWDDLNTQADDLMRWLLSETELRPAFAGMPNFGQLPNPGQSPVLNFASIGEPPNQGVTFRWWQSQRLRETKFPDEFALARTIGGVPSPYIEVRLGDEIIVKAREVDALSDIYVAQTFDHPFDGTLSDSENFMNNERRGQIRETIRMAQLSGRDALFNFSNGIPHQYVVDYIHRIATEYKVAAEITTWQW